MDFRDYTYVEAIANYKNISNAAKVLYISQPSLSKFLQKLEMQLGTQLFERVNKQMIPTYAGKQFLETGKKIALLQNKLNHTLDEINHKSAGSLNFATTSTRGNYILPRVLSKFKKEFPKYHVDVYERGVDELERVLSEGIIDLAVYSLPERNPEFNYYHINTEEIVVCLSSDSPLRKKAVYKKGFKYPWLDIALLKDETILLNDPVQWRIGRIGQQLLLDAHINPETTILRSLDTCLALSSLGLGFTFSFDICIPCFKNYLVAPTYFSVGEHPLHSEFVVAYRKNYALKPADKEFMALIKEEFGEENFKDKSACKKKSSTICL